MLFHTPPLPPCVHVWLLCQGDIKNIISDSIISDNIISDNIISDNIISDNIISDNIQQLPLFQCFIQLYLVC